MANRKTGYQRVTMIPPKGKPAHAEYRSKWRITWSYKDTPNTKHFEYVWGKSEDAVREKFGISAMEQIDHCQRM